MKSVPPGVVVDNLTEDLAIQIISMPTEVGIDTNSNKPIIKDIGRYGPYIKCGSTNRKIPASDNILDLTLERAIELLANNPGQTAILKELGQSNNMDIVIKDGRYGIYVTNGKVNVTLPKGMDYNTLDLNTALDLISKKKKKKRFYKR